MTFLGAALGTGWDGYKVSFLQGTHSRDMRWEGRREAGELQNIASASFLTVNRTGVYALYIRRVCIGIRLQADTRREEDENSDDGGGVYRLRPRMRDPHERPRIYSFGFFLNSRSLFSLSVKSNSRDFEAPGRWKLQSPSTGGA